MSLPMPFVEVLDAANQLPPEDQEELIAVLRRRLAERGRNQLVADIQEARREFAEGVCRPSTTDELMDKISS
jgi:hypothetical protein